MSTSKRNDDYNYTHPKRLTCGNTDCRYNNNNNRARFGCDYGEYGLGADACLAFKPTGSAPQTASRRKEQSTANDASGY